MSTPESRTHRTVGFWLMSLTTSAHGARSRQGGVRRKQTAPRRVRRAAPSEPRRRNAPAPPTPRERSRPRGQSFQTVAYLVAAALLLGYSVFLTGRIAYGA